MSKKQLNEKQYEKQVKKMFAKNGCLDKMAKSYFLLGFNKPVKSNENMYLNSKNKHAS